MTSVAVLLLGFSVQAQTPPKPALATKQKSVTAQSAWTGSLMSQGNFFSEAGKNVFRNELDVGYRLSSITTMSLWGAFAGPLSPTEDSKPEFEDPEVNLDFEVPFSGEWKRWSLATGVGGVIPATEASRADGLWGGARLTGSLAWQAGRWRLEQLNLLYMYGYNESTPDSKTENAEHNHADSEDGGDTHEADASENSRVYLSTANEIRVGARITKNFVWNLRTRYFTDTHADGPPDQRLRMSSKLGYKWIPQVETYLGAATETPFKEDSPRLFEGDSIFGFVGLFMSI